jgi:hypothetical protein
VGKPSSTIPSDEMAQLLREAKRLEIYGAAWAPIEFQDPDGCGVILIWTR